MLSLVHCPTREHLKGFCSSNKASYIPLRYWTLLATDWICLMRMLVSRLVSRQRRCAIITNAGVHTLTVEVMFSQCIPARQQYRQLYQI